MLYAIWTIGCQMNKADSEQVAATLEGLGMRQAAAEEQADIIVLNTCVVRGSAENKVEGKLAALKALKKRRPDIFVAVMGCFVPPDRSALASRLPHVDQFLTVAELPSLTGALAARQVAASGTPLTRERLAELTTLADRPSAESLETSPVCRYVPIITGCNNFCSYCIVPYRRGREASRAPADILAQIRQVVAEGAREVTLLGQNVDAYRYSPPDGGDVDLADLLRQVHQLPGLARIRFLTSHPRDMSGRLLEAVASLPKVCPAINLPVQAGDDAILASMGRGYTVAEYVELVKRIRQTVPGVALITDLIVGYPGESGNQFEAALRLLSEIRFDAVHVAAYSPREGTRAARMPDDVSPEEKARRLQAVESQQARIVDEINARLLGTQVEILVEGQHRGKWMGRTATDKIVFVESADDLRGCLARVHVTRTGPWSLQAALVAADS